MRITQKHGPLLLRQEDGLRATCGTLPALGPSAVDIGARVPGVVQGVVHRRLGQRPPEHLAMSRATVHTTGKGQSLLGKGSHRLEDGAHLAERGKQAADALLHLLVWIEHDLIVRGVDQTDGQPQPQLAASCLVEHPPHQARTDDVKLRLGHGPLEAEQLAVVEVRRIVDALLVQDEGGAQGADLQQPVPVAGVAGQPGDLQPHHDAHLPQAHLADQPGEALPPL